MLSGYLDLIVRIGWLNSYKAIIIPGAASVFGVFLFRQSMQGVPDELLHAGRVDGCSELRLLVGHRSARHPPRDRASPF